MTWGANKEKANEKTANNAASSISKSPVAINLGCFYTDQDDFSEEEDDLGKMVKQASAHVVYNSAKDKEPIEEDQNVAPRWEVNYDALYAVQDVAEEVVEAADLQKEEEEADVKPRWAINYDALYANEDVDEMVTEATGSDGCGKDGQAEAHVYPRSEDENEEAEEVVKPRWEVNYDALYAGEDEADAEIDTMVSEEEEPALKTTEDDARAVSDADCTRDTVAEVEVKPHWAINYDAPYASQISDDVGVIEETQTNKTQEENEETRVDSHLVETDQDAKLVEDDQENNENSENKTWGHINYDAIYACLDDDAELEGDMEDEAAQTTDLSQEAENVTDDVKAGDDDDEKEVKPIWEINYDALYSYEDEVVEEVDEKGEPQEEATSESLESETVGNREAITADDKLDEETPKPRWEINYDALYANEDDIEEVADETMNMDESVESAQIVIDAKVEAVTEEVDDKDDEEESATQPSSRWQNSYQINYDALYANEDEEVPEELEEPSAEMEETKENQSVEEITGETISAPEELPQKEIEIQEKQNESKNDEVEGEDTPSTSRRWQNSYEVNYDALYAVEEEEVEEAMDVIDDSSLVNDQQEPQSLIDKEKTEEDEADEPTSKPRWEVNYDALYAIHDDTVVEEEPETSDMTEVDDKSITVDVVVGDDKKEETKTEEEESEEEEAEYKPRWEINYDALYANEDEIIEENDQPEAGEVVDDQQIETSTPSTEVKDAEAKVENHKEAKEEKEEEEEEEEEEPEEYKPRWEINYDALYANEDDYVEEIEEPVVDCGQTEVQDPSTVIPDEKKDTEQKVETEVGKEEGEEEDYKPRWEVNYDALYAVDDDEIGANDEVVAVQEEVEEEKESDMEEEKPIR